MARITRKQPAGAASGGLTAEQVRDTIAAALRAGEGIQVNVDDAADTITVSSTIPPDFGYEDSTFEQLGLPGPPGARGATGPQGPPGQDADDLGDYGSSTLGLTHGTFQQDDHRIYALLAGRAGGQTLIGGLAANENLRLQSTADATRGFVQTVGRVQMLVDGYTLTSGSLVVMGGLGAITMSNATASQNVLRGYQFNPAINWTTAPSTSAMMTLFQFASTISLPNSLAMSDARILTATPTISPASGTTTTLMGVVSVYNGPTFSAIAGGGTGTGRVYGVEVAPSVGAGWTLSEIVGVRMRAPGGGSDVNTMTEIGGLIMDDVFTTRVVNAYTIKSIGTSVRMEHAGPMKVGATGAPAASTALDVVGNQKLSALMTTYNSDTTAGNGLASVVGRVARTAQTASIATTSIFTPPADGEYLVTIYVQDTVAGSAGTLTVTIGWTDEVGATTYTTGTLALSATGRLQDRVTMRAKTTAAITYATTLTGVVGSPQYSLHIDVCRLA